LEELGWGTSSTSQQSSLPQDHPTWAIWNEGGSHRAKKALGLSGLYKAPGNTPVSLKSSKSASILCLTSLRIGVIISTHPYPFYKAKKDELYKDYIMIFNSSIIADTQGANNGDGEITKKGDGQAMPERLLWTLANIAISEAQGNFQQN
jgi:hypothetical protein